MMPLRWASVPRNHHLSEPDPDFLGHLLFSGPDVAGGRIPNKVESMKTPSQRAFGLSLLDDPRHLPSSFYTPCPFGEDQKPCWRRCFRESSISSTGDSETLTDYVTHPQQHYHHEETA